MYDQFISPLCTALVLCILALIFLFMGYIYPRKKEPNSSGFSKQVDLLVKLIELDKDWIKTSNYWWHPSRISIYVGLGGRHVGVLLNCDQGKYIMSNDIKGMRLTDSERTKVWNAVINVRDKETKIDFNEFASSLIKYVETEEDRENEQYLQRKKS